MRSALLLLVVATTLGGESPPRILSFSLDEKPAELTKIFSASPTVFRANGYRLLQFHDTRGHQEQGCEGAFDWEFYIDGNGAIQSVTWNPERAISTEELFPLPTRKYVANGSGGIKTGVFVRQLPGNRLLIANVNSPDQQAIQNVTIIRAGSVSRFLPWVAGRLKE